MGVQSWMLAFCDEDPRVVLRGEVRLDRDAARAAAQLLYPGRTLTPIADGTVGDDANPDDDVVYVGVFGTLTLACTSLAALDHPAQLSAAVLGALPAKRVYLHAVHSVVDWFAYAVWAQGRLQRALSLAPDHGILDDEGVRLPFEEPYWAGLHPAVDPGDIDPADEPYAFPFHPLELAEAARHELFGFVFEGLPASEDADPFEIPLAGFALS